MTVECRPYAPQDEVGVVDLYREVFGRELSPAWREWFTAKNPSGPCVGRVLESEGRIVGHYSVQPRSMLCNGQPCLAGIVYGAMINSQNRNFKLFVDLAQATFQQCREAGMSFLYAFPRDEAWKLHRMALGWQQLPAVSEWDGPLPTTTGPSNANVRVFSAWSAELDGLRLPQLIGNANVICGKRTAEWLKWRFFDQPGGEYVLHFILDGSAARAYAVTKQYSRDGILYAHVVDARLDGEDRSAAGSLLGSVWRQFAASRVERVSGWPLCSRALEAELNQAGFSPVDRGSNFGYLDLSAEQSGQLPCDARWCLQMADSDVY